MNIDKVVKNNRAVINIDDEGLKAYKKRKEKDRKLKELEYRIKKLEEIIFKNDT